MPLRKWNINRFGVVLVCGAVAVGIWVVIIVAVMGESRERTSWRTVWERGSGPLDETRFLTLMFPTRSSEDSACDAALRSIDRAVLVSMDESKRERIGVFVGAQEQLVDAECLTWSVSEADRERLIGNLNTTLKSWGDDTDWRSASATLHAGNDDEYVVHLMVFHHSGDRRVFEYAVHGTGVEPQRLMRYSSKAAALSLAAASVELIALHAGGGLLIGVVLWRRARRRRLRGA